MKKTAMILTALAGLSLAASVFAANTVSCQDMVGQWKGNLGTKMTDVTLGISNAGSQSIIPNVGIAYTEDDGTQGEVSMKGSCSPLSDGSGVQMNASSQGSMGSMTITLKNDTPTQANVSAHVCETVMYCIDASGNLSKS